MAKEKSAYTFDRPPGTGMPLMVVSRFVATADGQLEHWTDGVLRATVSPEGFDGYMEQWPDAVDVVREIRGGAGARYAGDRSFDGDGTDAADRADNAADRADNAADDAGDAANDAADDAADRGISGTMSIPARKKKK